FKVADRRAGAVAAEVNDFHFRFLLLKKFGQFLSAYADGHNHIHEHERDLFLMLMPDRQRIDSARCLQDTVTMVFEDIARNPEDRRLVLDDKYRLAAATH